MLIILDRNNLYVKSALQFFIMRRLDRYDNNFLVHAGDLLSVIAFIALIPLTIYYQAIPGLALSLFHIHFFMLVQQTS